MAADWLQYLGDLQSARPIDRDAWLAAHPLRAFLQDKAVGEIRRCHISRYAPADPNAPHRMLFRWKSGGTFFNLVLPSDVAFRGLRFSEAGADDPRNYLIHFDTDEGVVTTNPQELSNVLGFSPTGARSPEALLSAFQSLSNAFRVNLPPPWMPSFKSHHLGELEPGPYGAAETEWSVPALSEKPLHVSVDWLGEEDAEAIDDALDQFTANLEGLLRGATEHVVKNMRDFCEAAYRDPDGPPITGPGRDEAFEAVLSLTDPRDIWAHVRPYGLRLFGDGSPPDPPEMQRVAEGPIYVTLYCHCDWEVEHGLGLVWREGTTLSAIGTNDVRVSDGL